MTMPKLSLEIWEKTYKYKDENDYRDTIERVARSCSEIEKDSELWYKNFKYALEDFKFVPGGRILSNVGTGLKNSLMNCFTHNIAFLNKDSDSIDNIFKELYSAAKILSKEGGYGTNFSFIRPKGSIIVGSGNLHPGVVKYIELWDKMSEIITLGAPELKGYTKDQVSFYKEKPRKGASMAILNIWHPDIKDFITAKLIQGKFTKFNFSVGIIDEFMEALKNDDYFYLEFPDYINFEYEYKEFWNGDIKSWKALGYKTIIYEKVKAKDLWNLIMESTYKRAEPGVIFLDKINKLNPLSYIENIQQTNPCGEQPLPEADACNLGALNLVKFYKNDRFDFENFADIVRISVRFLDNIIDLSEYPLPEIEKNMKNKRRIGLGIMGLGSLLYLMNIRYGSKESLELIEEIFKTKAMAEIETSALLGKEKGSFALFDKEKYFNTLYWKKLSLPESFKKKIENIGEMRNSHRSTIAPTGNTSILSEIVSGGIEPVFMKSYKRFSQVTMKEVYSLKESGMEIPNFEYGEFYETKDFKFTKKGNDIILKSIDGKYEISDGVMRKEDIVEDYGFKHTIHKDSPALVDINDLTVNDHLSVLDICSKYIDSSISKTINVPNDYSFEDFKNVYLIAYNSSHIKGVTTYREGTMAAVLETIKEESPLVKLFKESGNNVIKDISVKLEDNFECIGYKHRDGKNKYYVIIGFLKDFKERPFAIFLNSNTKEKLEYIDPIVKKLEALALDSGILSKFVEENIKKYAHQKALDKLARSISLLLRHNVNLSEIIKVLDELNPQINSIVHFIRKVLSKYVKDSNQLCPNCNSSLSFEESCYKCFSCGYSKC